MSLPQLLLEHARHLCFLELEFDHAALVVVVDHHSIDLQEVSHQLGMFESARDDVITECDVAILERDCLQAHQDDVSNQLDSSKQQCISAHEAYDLSLQEECVAFEATLEKEKETCALALSNKDEAYKKDVAEYASTVRRCLFAFCMHHMRHMCILTMPSFAEVCSPFFGDVVALVRYRHS